MKLYFMRHGHAEPQGNVPDAQRVLTEGGIERIQIAAQVIAVLGISPVHIYSSPRIRALSTAEIVGVALNTQVEVREEVNFDFSIDAVRHFAEANGDVDMMFVGHEPTLSETIGRITGGEVVMKPGSLARIDIYDIGKLRGDLVWLIAPKVFDVLGKNQT